MPELIFVTEKDFSVAVKEVIRELDRKPYLLLRVSILGPHFPRRDSYPFVRIGTIQSLMAEISRDQKELRGYFPVDVEVSGRAEFGYASQIIGSVPLVQIPIVRLEPERMDRGVTKITLRELGPFKRQR
ncbi:MAG TPA: hypothetical protein VJ656_05245 [Pyrinomonadaceae bacterium]|nr:hypothetical protein [Pyrinomonadaceae bacterium]